MYLDILVRLAYAVCAGTETSAAIISWVVCCKSNGNNKNQIDREIRLNSIGISNESNKSKTTEYTRMSAIV